MATQSETEAVWAEIDRDFRINGFLSNSLEPLATHFLKVFGDWFALVHDLNRLAHKVYIAHSDLLPGKHLFDPVQLGLQMTPRALAAAQAAAVLCRTGMGIEGQTLIRVAFETNFWIGFLANEGQHAADALRRAGLHGQIKLYEEVVARWDELDEQTKAQFPAIIEKYKAARDELSERAPGMSVLSTRAGFHKEYVYYRDLSGGAVHTSLRSIQDYIWMDDDGFHKGHNIGPSEEATAKALRLNCFALFGTIEALRRLTMDDQFEPDASMLRERFHAMLAETPE